MIQVTVYRTKDENIRSFEISGHAESGPYGYDLVCAGVSAVSIGAVKAVLELCDIDLEIKQGEEGGYLAVNIPNNLSPDERDKVQLLFEGMLISLKAIEMEYNKFIQIRQK